MSIKEWNARKRRLKNALADVIALKRLPEVFAVRRGPCRELDDPVVKHCEEIWPEWQKRRLPPKRRVGAAFTAERVSFPGMDGEPDIAGILRIPKTTRKPGTAVLCLHGHARGLVIGKEITEFYAVPYAEHGLVTFAPDALRFGERRIKAYDPMEVDSGGQMLFLAERMLAAQAFLRGATYVGLQLAEYMRCIDFLQSLPGVERIVVMGHSMGGIYAFWLGALDERVDVTVCLAGLLSYKAVAERDTARYHGIITVVPGLLKVCETADIVSLVAPRKFIALHAEEDLGFPIDEVQRIVSAASAVYAIHKAESNLISRAVAGDHGDMLTEAKLMDVFNLACENR